MVIKMKMNEYEAVIEAALFVAGDKVSLAVLADMIEMDKATTKAIVNTLINRYSGENRGIRIIEIGDGYQMCTSPECFDSIRAGKGSRFRRRFWRLWPLSPTNSR